MQGRENVPVLAMIDWMIEGLRIAALYEEKQVPMPDTLRQFVAIPMETPPPAYLPSPRPCVFCGLKFTAVGKAEVCAVCDAQQ